MTLFQIGIRFKEKRKILLAILITVIILALCFAIFLVFRLKRSDREKKVFNAVSALLAILITAAVAPLTNTIHIPRHLSEAQLYEYVTYIENDGNIEYDKYVCPTDKNYTFVVPNKYLSCIYIDRNGEEHRAKSGDKIKPKSAKMIISYINENENKVSLSHVRNRSSEYYSLYIDIQDTILHNKDETFGYPVSGVRYVICDEEGTVVAGGTSNGKVIEIANAYEGIYTITLKGENFVEQSIVWNLTKNNLIKPEMIPLMVHGMYYDSENKVIEYLRESHNKDDYKEYWSKQINMRYANRKMYSVIFDKFIDNTYNDYVFYTNEFVLRCDNKGTYNGEEVNLAVLIPLQNKLSEVYQILDGAYYIQPLIMLQGEADKPNGMQLLDIDEYKQLFDVPKSIEKGSFHHLKFEPSFADFDKAERHTIDGLKFMRVQ